MTRSVAPNQEDVFVRIRLITDTDGTPATGIVAAQAGHQMWYQRESAAVVTDGTSAADMGGLTSTHTDWEFIEIRNGYYWASYPDAAFVEGVASVLCGMDATGISCVAELVLIDALLKFQGKADSVTATTTTFPTGTTPKQGDQIYVIDGTGGRQTRLVRSATGEVATHLAWDVNISATTSTIILLPGDETLGDGGINADAAVSSRSTVTTSQVNVEAANALATYDGPTRAEATADKAEVLAVLPAALSTAGNIKADVEEVNEITVTGDGQTGTEWGP